jgi:hypothetical protein
MTDWREAFPDDSRVAWERRVATEAGADAWTLARPFVEAWRRDNTTELARRLETHVAAARRISLASGLVAAEALDEFDALGVDQVMVAVRSLLQRAGVDRLVLFRGQAAHAGALAGEEVETVGRGLTAWTPDRPIAIGHAGRRRPAVVLRSEVGVDQVALAYDPSSDGEIVLLGPVAATVDTLVP